MPGISKLRQLHHRVEIVFAGVCPDFAAEFETETLTEKGKEERAAREHGIDDIGTGFQALKIDRRDATGGSLEFGVWIWDLQLAFLNIVSHTEHVST